MIIRYALALILFLFCLPAHAAIDVLSVDLARDHVDITTGFNGAELLLFGVRDHDGDIAVTIKGPPKQMIVRRKDRVFGVWMNRTAVRFDDVPGFYHYALSDMEMLRPEAPAIDLQSLRFKTGEGAAERSKEHEAYQKALIRNKQEQGLFAKTPAHIRFIQDNFFRVSFTLPPNVPTGRYTITTYLLAQGAVQDQKETVLHVEQVGISAAVNSFARHKALIYALLCVAFAMGMGWLANMVRNRLR